METVWVYPGVHCLIVKRKPFHNQIPYVSKEGIVEVLIQNGVAMPLPQWKSIQKDVKTNNIYAIHNGNMYDITDLCL